MSKVCTQVWISSFDVFKGEVLCSNNQTLVLVNFNSSIQHHAGVKKLLLKLMFDVFKGKLIRLTHIDLRQV